MSEPSNPPPSVPSLWQRRVIHPIAVQLTQGTTPDKIALTVAVGSAFALFPILGTTTLLCLIAGIILSLNQPIIQIVNGICTPLHFTVIPLLFRLGAVLFDVPRRHLNIRMINQMFWDDPGLFLHRMGLAALHAICAWALLAPFWIGLVYFCARPVFREWARMRAAAAVTATDAPPPVHPVP